MEKVKGYINKLYDFYMELDKYENEELSKKEKIYINMHNHNVKKSILEEFKNDFLEVFKDFSGLDANKKNIYSLECLLNWELRKNNIEFINFKIDKLDMNIYLNNEYIGTFFGTNDIFINDYNKFNYIENLSFYNYNFDYLKKIDIIQLLEKQQEIEIQKNKIRDMEKTIKENNCVLLMGL